MVTINDYLKKVKNAQLKILDEQERSVVRNEDKIISMNISQIEDGMGANGKELKNSNTIFKGVYTMATQLINPDKVAGDLYTFRETGNFFLGFEANVTADLSHVDVFSTGTGSGDKAIFFKGYNNLFGLDSKNAYNLNYNIILPDLLKFLKQTL